MCCSMNTYIEHMVTALGLFLVLVLRIARHLHNAETVSRGERLGQETRDG
jgi:hypothetical protein